MSRIVVALTLLISSLSIAQNKSEYFKVFTKVNGSEPAWVQQMYAPNANVFLVEELYYRYYKTHEFKKNIHTQNFKYWLRTTEEMVTPKGFILKPSAEQLAEKLTFLRSQRSEISSSRSALWENIGPYQTYKNDGSLNLRPTQVNIFTMAVAPSDNDVMYGAAEGGGIFKSIDHGMSWDLVTLNEVFTNCQDIKVDPFDEDIVYAASGDDIYKTVDGGLVWSLNFTTPSTVEQFYININNSDTVFAATANGLFRSIDAGGSWTDIFNKRCWDIEAHVLDPNTLYLSTHNSSLNRAEVFKSEDGGDTWTLKDTDWYMPAVPGSASDIGCKLGVTAADPDRLYAGLIGDSKAGDNGWIGVYYSLDGADTWVNADGIDGGPYDPGSDASTNWYVAGYSDGYHQGWYNFDLDVSQINPDKIWIGTIWFCESSNRGENIEYVRGTRSLEMHADIQDIDVVGNEIWVASDGGLNYSNDECLTVEVRNNNITSSTYWGFNQGWNEDTWTGGRYHNGNAVWHENYGIGKTMFMGGAETATGYINPLNNRRTHYSDIGDKYTPDDLSISSTDIANFSMYPNESYGLLSSSEVEYDPRYANHLYLGRDNIFYKSTDGGASFEELYAFSTGHRVLEFEVSRSNPDVIYCLVRSTTTGRIYKSTDGGNSFGETNTIPALNRSRLDLTLNPSDENELWVSSYYAAEGEKVYSTEDGGMTWIDRYTSSLNSHQIKDIFYQAGTNDVVYLATTYGVFHWDDATSQWINYSDQLPFITRALYFRPFYRDSKLRLSSGRGIWSSPLVETSLPIAQPMTSTDTIYCSRDTVQFDCYSVLDHAGATWEWTFAPAPAYVSSTSDRNPKVVFDSEGSYDVTLTVTDGGGNSDTKTVTNMVTLVNQCAPEDLPGLAMQTFGTGDFAQTPDLEIGATNTFTVSAWVKPDGIQPEYSGIVFNDNESAGLNFRASNELAYHWPGGQWWWASGLFVPEDVWSHVALVVTPGDISVYLNGVKSTHSITPSPAVIDYMKFGSYKGWGSRNFVGEMDEVCIWNRSLTQEEIRELRHLTRTGDIPYTDDLVAYYQFNLPNSTLVSDKIGVKHATLNNNAEKIVSSAPVGGGHSDRITISTSGLVDFPNTQMQIEFPAGTNPDGEIVVTRIYLEPNELPSTNPNLGNYWIVNNYGNEASFDALTEVKFLPYSAIAIGDPSEAKLYTRSENEHLNSWTEICAADDLISGALYYSATCNITEFSQFFIVSASSSIIVSELDEEALELSVYPNPTNDIFFINTGEGEYELELFNLQGQRLQSIQLGEGINSVDMSNYAKGMYVYSLKSEGEIIKSDRIVKN
ncbi:MAG: T9SS type A sorting domain-containing protein [Crocinitomicaceae bacterium]|nr:T9SS type A sorting domain-containing protein [Crocinitomicaceae bacterium]